jgi:hypothetical protein
MTHRFIMAAAQYVDIRDEASVLSTVASMAYRAISVGVPGTLTSAIERSYRIRCHNDPSRHCSRPQYVDIRDEASVLSTVASTAYRAISARFQYVDICDTASVLEPPPQ